MSFSWQSVVSQFEIQYDTFCAQNQEKNIYFDYAGVNPEGSSPDTHLRRSWAHLLLLDATLAYTEHKTRTTEMTQSLAFRYHKTLRKCIQATKRSQTFVTEHDLNNEVIVNVPFNWSSLEALQQSLCLSDNTVSDIYEFLVSSPLLEDRGDLIMLITDMVNDIPVYDTSTNTAPLKAVVEKTDGSNSENKSNGNTIDMYESPSNGNVDKEQNSLANASNTSSLLSLSSSPPMNTPTIASTPNHTTPPSFLEPIVLEARPHLPVSTVDFDVIPWAAIAVDFSNKCEAFVFQGHSKILSDVCDFSTHCTSANVHEWVDLLLLDAILCVLLRVATKKRTSTCFNQHRALRDCVQSKALTAFLQRSQTSLNSACLATRLDISRTTIAVTDPWDNILNFSDLYSKEDLVVDAIVPKRNSRKMSFKREKARSRAGLVLCGSHAFKQMSLKSAIQNVVQHLYWGTKVPTLVSAHDTAVSTNLMLFSRTVLAAHSNTVDESTNHDKKINEEGTGLCTLSTFCSSILDMDRRARTAVHTVAEASTNSAKRQRV